MVRSVRVIPAAIACVMALAWFGSTPVAAMPLRAALPAVAVGDGGGPLATPVHYRHRHWRHRHYRPGVSFWFGSGPLVGVPYWRYGYRPGPYYYGADPYYYSRAPLPPSRYYYRGRPVPGSPDWYAYCASKYKSFNPRTGLYLAYSGKYRRCR
ncbi:BA14K family protein [Breoghania sp. JC706]|uniref:BA14K family protein n=1 Tax=Breoghania sp. JC706 TaxID=3117732 RepID=UPI00300B063D